MAKVPRSSEPSLLRASSSAFHTDFHKSVPVKYMTLHRVTEDGEASLRSVNSARSFNADWPGTILSPEGSHSPGSSELERLL